MHARVVKARTSWADMEEAAITQDISNLLHHLNTVVLPLSSSLESSLPPYGASPALHHVLVQASGEPGTQRTSSAHQLLAYPPLRLGRKSR
jgi:hypothetical protein